MKKLQRKMTMAGVKDYTAHLPETEGQETRSAKKGFPKPFIVCLFVLSLIVSLQHYPVTFNLAL